MTLFDDWHIQSDIIQKSVESQFKAGEKLWQIRSLLQKKYYNFSHTYTCLQVLKILQV